MAQNDIKGLLENAGGTFDEIKLQDYLLPLGGGTLTGAVDLGENAGLLFDAALSADGKYSGIVEAGTAGVALAFGEVCYLAVADSLWKLAKADVAATSGGVKLGICVLAAAGNGSVTKMLMYGKIRADAKFPALEVGALVYLSAAAAGLVVAGHSDSTTGQPTATDNVIRVVGWANTADDLMFSPSQDYITHI